MASRQRLHVRHAVTAAVYVRLVSFLAAGIGVLAIPAALTAAATGHLTERETLLVAGIAFALIVASALAVRPFDPLRD